MDYLKEFDLLAIGSLAVAGALLPVLPVNFAKTKLSRFKVTTRNMMISSVAIPTITYGGFLAVADKPIFLAGLATIGLGAAYCASAAQSAMAAQISAEGPAPCSAVSSRLTRMRRRIYSARVLGALGLASDIGVTALTGISGIVAGPALVYAALQGVSAIKAGLNYDQMSDEKHEAELLRFYTWMDKNKASTIIHMPNEKKETLASLDKIVALLAKAGIKAAILCRGRKAFRAALSKYSNSFLSRTVMDLDDFARSPVEQVLHLPNSHSSMHMVSISHLKHILCDDAGNSLGIGRLHKDLRMFDEIWTVKPVDHELIADANRFGIRVLNLNEKPTPVAAPDVKLLFPSPRVRETRIPAFGVIFPLEQDHKDDVALANLLKRYEELVPILEALADHFSDGFRIHAAFGAGTPKDQCAAVIAGLRGAYGKDTICEEKTPVDVMNKAQRIIAGDWTDHYPRFAACRDIWPDEVSAVKQALAETFPVQKAETTAEEVI